MPTNWRRPLLSLVLRAHCPVTARELALLRRLDRATAAEIRRVHEERLAALLRHAYARTDYYREVLGDLGVVRGDGREVDLGRFERIPILTKDVIRAQGPRLRAREPLPDGRKAYANRTGGSTGQPVEYWQDDHYWHVNVATKLYHFEMLGKRLGEPELKIWGSDRDLVLETGTRRRRIQNLAYHRRIVTCGALRPEDIDRLIDEVNRFRPRIVWGYVDALYTVAEYVNRTGAELHGPAAVLGGGGTLFPQMRESIRRAFKAPMINIYGSREMGDVACECAAMDGLHVSSTSHKVEVVDPAGRPIVGEDGDLILTSLHNYAMPFVRYRIGDRGRLSSRPCACGRGYPVLADVSGRGMEAFVRSDGAVVSPIYLITSVGGLADSGLVRRIQFVQEDYDRVVVRLAPDASATNADIARWAGAVRAKFRAVMGPTCDVRVERVADIPPTDSGKYLYTVSKVRPREPTLAKLSA